MTFLRSFSRLDWSKINHLCLKGILALSNSENHLIWFHELKHLPSAPFIQPPLRHTLDFWGSGISSKVDLSKLLLCFVSSIWNSQDSNEWQWIPNMRIPSVWTFELVYDRKRMTKWWHSRIRPNLTPSQKLFLGRTLIWTRVLEREWELTIVIVQKWKEWMLL